MILDGLEKELGIETSFIFSFAEQKQNDLKDLNQQIVGLYDFVKKDTNKCFENRGSIYQNLNYEI